MSESTAKVIDFETKGEAPELELPGVDASCVITLPENRQIQMRTAFLQSSTLPEINSVFDRLFAAADRQEARYLLKGLRRELGTRQTVLRNMSEDETRLDAQHEIKLAEIDAEIAALRKDSSEIAVSGEAQHVRKGKLGKYEPVGHVKATLDRMGVQLQKLADKKEHEENTRIAAKQTFADSAKRHREEIDKIAAEIAECEALVGG